MIKSLVFFAVVLGINFSQAKVEISLLCDCDAFSANGEVSENSAVRGTVPDETPEDVFRCMQGDASNYSKTCWKAYMNASHLCSERGKALGFGKIRPESCTLDIQDIY